jgi:hypothetical protein
MMSSRRNRSGDSLKMLSSSQSEITEIACRCLTCTRRMYW